MRYRITTKGSFILLLVLVIVLAYPLKLCFNIVRFPELHSSKLKHTLKCNINAGDELAIEYYQKKYIDNGIQLFD